MAQLEKCSSRRSRAGRAGQTTTELMLIISVVVIGLAYFSYLIGRPLEEAFNDLFGEGTDTPSSRNVPDQIQRGYISENPL